ncbi:bifunctional Cullin repeat-like-containing domain superfamily/Cullin homology domain/Cullin [Babesia duncani]|uniref:Bifunctional Cullin repeat-like-containing domain superfamily/Cullin homology domain/Cullin n=1 Tax=Babesia duncani TaxID=323732 RepID=A0AAD9PLD7_9APIC|nr:bifunctional Cullin repeat-like-containing domain superfamily/Cullin homology domain/Cullin [Babesia duncani]
MIKSKLQPIFSLIACMNEFDENLLLDFIPTVLSCYSKYYENVAQVWLQDLNLWDYLEVAQECKIQEVILGKQLGGTQFETELEATLFQALYLSHQNALLNKLLDALNDGYPSHQMACWLFEIFSKFTRGVEAIANALKQKCAMITDSMDDTELANAYLDACGFTMAMDPENASFDQVILKSFGHEFNRHEELVGTLLQWEDASKLKEIACMYRFVHNKAHFIYRFQFVMAARLLTGKSTIAQEEVAIALLKKYSREIDTGNLAAMIRQVKTSQQLVACAKTQWPEIADYQPIKLDAVFQNEMQAMHDSYVSENTRHNLEWRFCASKVELNVGEHQVIVDVYQATILLNLAKSHPQSLQELSNKLETNPETLLKIMDTMINAKVPLLFNKGGEIQFNPCFTGPANFMKLLIPKDVAASMEQMSLLTRENKMDCMLVAKLKVETRMQLKDFISWASRQDFKANADFVKARIDRLCDREYMQIEGDFISYLP